MLSKKYFWLLQVQTVRGMDTKGAPIIYFKIAQF